MIKEYNNPDLDYFMLALDQINLKALVNRAVIVVKNRSVANIINIHLLLIPGLPISGRHLVTCEKTNKYLSILENPPTTYIPTCEYNTILNYDSLKKSPK